MSTEQEFAQKFLGDQSFREELKRDPKATMRSHGVEVPDDVEIEVLESTAQKHYIVLPPLQTSELTEDQLTGAQGGTIFVPIKVATWSPIPGLPGPGCA